MKRSMMDVLPTCESPSSTILYLVRPPTVELDKLIMIQIKYQTHPYQQSQNIDISDHCPIRSGRSATPQGTSSPRLSAPLFPHAYRSSIHPRISCCPHFEIYRGLISCPRCTIPQTMICPSICISQIHASSRFQSRPGKPPHSCILLPPWNSSFSCSKILLSTPTHLQIYTCRCHASTHAQIHPHSLKYCQSSPRSPCRPHQGSLPPTRLHNDILAFQIRRLPGLRPAIFGYRLRSTSLAN